MLSRFTNDCLEEIQDLQKRGIIGPDNQIAYCKEHADEYADTMSVSDAVDLLCYLAPSYDR